MSVEDFLGYARKHTDSQRDSSRYGTLIKRVVREPSMIGLDKYDHVFEGVCFRDETDGHKVAVVDVVAFHGDDVYFVKVRLGKERGRKLREAYLFARNIFDIAPHLILMEDRRTGYRELPIPVEDLAVRGHDQ